MNNYTISVPVFVRYLHRLQRLLEVATIEAKNKNISERELLDLSLQKGMLPLGQQINVAASFAVRGCFPLAGREVPELYYNIQNFEGIQANLKKVINALEAMRETEFITAAVESIDIQPGETSNTQTLTATDYVQIYALPNFFFHWTMVYALLRQYGFEIGKHDFDGLHQFPPGFSFVK